MIYVEGSVVTETRCTMYSPLYWLFHPSSFSVLKGTPHTQTCSAAVSQRIKAELPGGGHSVLRSPLTRFYNHVPTFCTTDRSATEKLLLLVWFEEQSGQCDGAIKYIFRFVVRGFPYSSESMMYV